MEIWLWVVLAVVVVLVVQNWRKAAAEIQRDKLIEQRRRWDREARLEREAKAAALKRAKELAEQNDAAGQISEERGHPLKPSRPKEDRLYISDNDAAGYDSAKIRAAAPAAPAAKKPVPRAGPSIEVQVTQTYDFDIVGESRCQANLVKVAGPKEALGKEFYCVATIEREPRNEYDPNACVVKIDRKKVGYIPRGDNKKLIAERSEQGFPFDVPAVIVGGWVNENSEGQYGVRLAMPANSLPATAQQKQMVRYVEGRLPRGLTQSQVKHKVRQWDTELNDRYIQWESLQEVIEHLQSADGREEFEIKKPATALIRDAFEQLIGEGEDPEDLASGCDEVVERMLVLKPDLIR